MIKRFKYLILIWVAIFLFIGCSGKNSSEEDLSWIEKQVVKQKKDIKTDAARKLNFKQFNYYLEQIDKKKMVYLNENLFEKNVSEIQKGYREKRFNIKEVVTYYLKRLKNNQNLNVLVELNPDLFKVIENLEKKEMDLNKYPLYGIPVLLKDNIGTGDKLHNSAGAAALRNLRCDRDAYIVKKLREAGAIILGKSNLSEWANFMTSNSSNGYSALGGQTQNPYGDFDVGGSSSGSAAAVAGNLSTLSIGTETCGSLIYPASQNSIVTLKPTVGLISRDRIIPISFTQDTAGPMGKNVKDIALLFETLIGYDKNDKKTEIAKDYQSKKIGEYLQKDALKGKKIGVVINEEITKWYREGDQKIIKRIIEEMKNAGAKIKEIKLSEKIYNIDMMSVYLYEFENGVNNYFKNIGKSFSLKKVIDINKQNDKSYAFYGQDLLVRSYEDKTTEKENIKNVQKNLKNSKIPLDEAFKNHGLDAIMTLSNYLSAVYCPCGYPAVNVPAGYRKSGEPIGLTLIGKYKNDRNLLGLAYSYEKNTKNRKNCLKN